MPFVAGNEIDAHCSKCGKDTKHTVIEVHSGIVQVVRCMDCKDQHAYKKPVAYVPPKKKPARSTAKRGTRKKKEPVEVGPPREWMDMVMGKEPEVVKPYTIKETFTLNEIVEHKNFGLGVVTELHPDGKITVAFRESRKKLVHGRS